jgi:hypothetical protein
VDRSSRDKQDVAGLERHGRLALDFIFQRTFKHIDDLLARMGVPRSGRSRIEVNAHLDRFAPRSAEIVPLQVGSPRTCHSCLLCLRGVDRQTDCAVNVVIATVSNRCPI